MNKNDAFNLMLINTHITYYNKIPKYHEDETPARINVNLTGFIQPFWAETFTGNSC